jgi:hypothetical protein
MIADTKLRFWDDLQVVAERKLIKMPFEPFTPQVGLIL